MTNFSSDLDQSLKPLILIDGTSYIFRAFHALPPLTNKAGHPTGAIAGFCHMLHKIFQDYPQSPLIVFFDAPKGSDYRRCLYPEYKKNRSSPPEDLIQQIEPIKSIVKALGLPFVCQEGVEADDILAYIAQHYARFGQVLVFSPDKDFCQIISDRIYLYNPMTQKILTPDNVLEKYGVSVCQIPDYFALVGDASDNIPGVPKIGPKTAQLLVSTYGSLEKIYESLNDLKPAVSATLREHQHEAFLSRKLFLFHKDCEGIWPFFLDKNHWPVFSFDIDLDLVREHYEKYELKRLLEKIPKKESVIYQDIVFDSLSTEEKKIVGPFLYFAPSKNTEDLWDLGEVQNNTNHWHVFQIKTRDLYEFFELNKETTFIAYDWKLLLKNAIDLPKRYSDLKLMIHIAEPDKKLDWDILIQPWSDKGFATVTCVLHILHQEYKDKLSQEQMSLLEHVEQPLIPVLFEIEKAGVLVDRDRLMGLDNQWRDINRSVAQKAYELVGSSFNMNSTKQLKEILFEKRGLEPTVKTPKGEPSTNEEALIALRGKDPLVDLVLEYRHYEKLISTYTSSWLSRLSFDNRLHTTYDQAGTVTGRLASFDPNLQNIPARSDEGVRLRHTMIAPKGSKILSLDYSQVELRLMAHFSQDPALIEAYDANKDLHAQTAAILFHVSLDQVTDRQRSIAKTVNFGLIYGMSAFGLAKQLHMTVPEASQLIADYFATYKSVQSYMSLMRELSKSQGYVSTLLGRKIPIRPASHRGGDNSWRAAVNGPLQGTASELIKMAMLKLQPLIKTHPGVQMILQVHDELVFEVPEKYLPYWAVEAQRIMESAMILRVPLIVDYSCGDCWE